MGTGVNSISLEGLANEIRTVYRSDLSRAETLIEDDIEQKLAGCTPTERLILLERLTDHFKAISAQIGPERYHEPVELSHLLSLLLGRRFSISDSSFEEFLEKLSHSLNTVFDIINEIVNVIHATLLGEGAEPETIRQIIGSDFEGKKPSESLENYLNQIKEAFMVAHRAFQQAAYTKVREMLVELGPDRIESTVSGGFKFGPLRKAALFETYKDKFLQCKGWVESGRFGEELLREFEKICQNHYNKLPKGSK